MPLGDYPEGVPLSNLTARQEVMLEVNRNRVYAAIWYIDTHPDLPEDEAVDVILESIGLLDQRQEDT
jgi:hypothetical protein